MNSFQALARWSSFLAVSLALAGAAQSPNTPATAPAPRHNVILFVADGLRRNSVTPADMPTFAALRSAGADFRNSHSVFPTFTTANASVIATGHGLGDTGDFSNTLYPGLFLAQPRNPAATGSITPFLEADDILADLNGFYSGNYFAEPTLLSAARAHGFNVASIGKLGPTAIQQLDAVSRDELGLLSANGAIIIDDATGQSTGLPLPIDVSAAIAKAGLALDSPLRTNGFGDSSQGSNGFSGTAAVPGTLAANLTQQQWFTDVTTRVVLPAFAADAKPFVLLFWSRDPDGTQHNQGDSFQTIAPGINGDTARLALRNADLCLKQLLDWLDRNPAIKANTDVLLTSDHGFATVSRREIDRDGTLSAEPSSLLDYEATGKEKPEPLHTLPTGFLAIDLALWSHQRLFDPATRATSGDSVYAEIALGGEKSQHPSTGSALLGDRIQRLDGADARLIVATNGGSDLLYIPSHSPAIARETIATLAGLDYVDGIFVDDALCPTQPVGTEPACPGTLPLSAIGLKGATPLPTPAIVVTFKHFNRIPGDLQTGIQIADTTLQEGQGQHGGFGRDQTWNNMAAIGPDFKRSFVDDTPSGNIDIAPTLASILGLDLPGRGALKGRILSEALTASTSPTIKPAPHETLISTPAANGRRTLLEFQQQNGVRYLDRACMLPPEKSACPD